MHLHSISTTLYFNFKIIPSCQYYLLPRILNIYIEMQISCSLSVFRIIVVFSGKVTELIIHIPLFLFPNYTTVFHIYCNDILLDSETLLFLVLRAMNPKFMISGIIYFIIIIFIYYYHSIIFSSAWHRTNILYLI